VTEYLGRPGERAWEVIQAANTTKPLAVRYSLDAAGGLSAISATASDGGSGRRTVTTRWLKDDFGREVGVVSPDSGEVFKRYNAADQLVHVRDATGTVTDLAYDAAGRLVARSVTPAATSSADATRAQTTRYVYQGTLLVEIQHPQQTERYSYDGRARVAGKTVLMTLADGQTSTSEERYRYDSEGRLVARTLPDGSELQYDRNGQGQIVAVSRQTSAWAPFGWGRTTFVSDLEGDLLGLRRATYGNGVVGQWQRSREGVLARVVYTAPPRTPGEVRTAFKNLMSQAHAQSAASAPTSPGTLPAAPPPPGAFGLERSPRALWDSRLLYDMAGNVLVQGQFADTAAARPAQTRYAYDGLNQLTQAVRAGTDEVDARAIVDRVSQPPSGTAWRYHHDSLGNRLLAQQQQPSDEMGRTTRLNYSGPASDRLAEVSMDPAGRPTADGERRYGWDAEGRLAEVSQPGKPASRFRYDARGLRVSKQVGGDNTHYLYDERRQRKAELDARGRVRREYVWLGTQLLAVIDLDTPRAVGAAPSDLPGRIAQFAATTWRRWTGHADTIVYVHANHLGAPVAMTDADAKTVWSAEYAPFGQLIGLTAPALTRVSAPGHPAVENIEGIRLDLRLPGQWEDHETGLYYNDHRYYDPRSGRYLNPDPSGLSGGLNAYAYVGNNPLGFVDPLGLVLFAFDGTNNTDDKDFLAANHSSLSNVWNFRGLYGGSRRYMTGVGTKFRDAIYGDIDPPLLDAGLNFTGAARIDRMLQYFDNEADLATDDSTMEIDIVGFSRGAAEARDFANQIVAHTKNGLYAYTVTDKGGQKETRCQKVDFRFMGLWDTVLSNNAGRRYDLRIPKQFSYVAQAVALNEYRGDNFHPYGSFGKFPLESILDSGTVSPIPVPGRTRIERGFIGAHADIGGGFDTGENQLAQVAFNWMVSQAGKAGVAMSASPATVAANPYIHDKSDSIKTGKPAVKAEDRQVTYRDGTATTQRAMIPSGGMSYDDTQTVAPDGTPMINYSAVPLDSPMRNTNFRTGTVDMAQYLSWLNSHGYDISLTATP
jgi:RHS repeat-associated protein